MINIMNIFILMIAVIIHAPKLTTNIEERQCKLHCISSHQRSMLHLCGESHRKKKSQTQKYVSKIKCNGHTAVGNTRMRHVFSRPRIQIRGYHWKRERTQNAWISFCNDTNGTPIVCFYFIFLFTYFLWFVIFFLVAVLFLFIHLFIDETHLIAEVI